MNWQPDNFMRFWTRVLVLGSVCGGFFSGCTSPVVITPTLLGLAPRATETITPTQTSSPTNQPTHTITVPTTTPSPTLQLCSPLEGILVEDLPELITNPFLPPHPGSDDPHQGVDYSILETNTNIAVPGHPVQAVLSGQVAGVIHDRFPYGNAILLETPLESLPGDWSNALQIPTPAPFQDNPPVLTCPDLKPYEPTEGTSVAVHSLYILYAHLKEAPPFRVSDPIRCGQVLGAIGDSGNALNPHLHLEIRVGPSGYQFSSMAHYDASANPEEMANYCIWRVSGLFQVIDPLYLLSIAP
jgi:murein DD-endopeptidase MepM/ murein hydrolase activator NlpD